MVETLLVVGKSKCDVVANRSVEDPRRLRNIGDRTPDTPRVVLGVGRAGHVPEHGGEEADLPLPCAADNGDEGAGGDVEWGRGENPRLGGGTLRVPRELFWGGGAVGRGGVRTRGDETPW